ncbi:hypothetical protein [Lentzea sp. CA-135723]|uniref:hypothetical protein n=1 Tax=Lentzea sp. CA-135723 TaxID=3239950 RepID=UPI003D9071F9
MADVGVTGRQAPQVIFPVRVAERFTKEINAHPRVEVGGKYVGFIRGVARHGTLEERLRAVPDLTFEVVDYIDDGPAAQRTASFHRGDPDWQTAEFRRLEAAQPDIEQLGSWHSHHPNGLGELSPGDVHGYQDTVDDLGHNHDYFLVSLGVDLKGFVTARHYLFIRGWKTYVELPLTALRISGDRSDPVVSRETREEAVPRHATAPSEQVPDPPPQEQPRAEPRQEHHTGHLSVPGWTDSPQGLDCLRAEREQLRSPEFANVRLSTAQGRLLARGWLSTKAGRMSMSLLYPSGLKGDDGLLKLITLDIPGIEVTLSGAQTRDLNAAKVLIGHFIRYADAHRDLVQKDPEKRWWAPKFTNWF